MKTKIPVITIDGPTASGKGTLSIRLAKALDWHYLESGIFYRLLGLLVIKKALKDPNEQDLLALCKVLEKHLSIKEVKGKTLFFIDQEEVTDRLREEDCSNISSLISIFPAVRAKLMHIGKTLFLHPPGLVTDGRDMGTVVFPEADLKLFLEADPEVRAKRRYLQLKELGVNGNLPEILANLMTRDKNDSQRAVAPLKPAENAVIIDVTSMGVDEVFQFALKLCQEKGFRQAD
jgi:CMP/dCMP kinase